jgi:RND family efflux transporter MFP subunit
MNHKVRIGIVVLVCIGIGYFAVTKYAAGSMSQKTPASTTAAVKFVSSTIIAGGTVTAQNQAKLNFQTAGKLAYLPVKEGDTVSVGQTVAQLDTYQLQRQLTAALNTYRSTRDTFDQTQQNTQNNVLRNQQATTFTRENLDNNGAINDAIKRIADQSQASLDNSVVTVELANYALQLSTLTSPLRGIVTHEDVTVSGVNITPTTSFTVADPDSMVFRANIPVGSIYYVSEGSAVTLMVDGVQDKLHGTIAKIYPSKVTLPSGQTVYQVDIAVSDLKKSAKLDQSGTAIISTNAQSLALVPAWTVLSGKYVWVDNHGTPELKTITVGKIHDNEIEVINGLSLEDKIITDPKIISKLKYKVL